MCVCERPFTSLVASFRFQMNASHCVRVCLCVERVGQWTYQTNERADERAKLLSQCVVQWLTRALYFARVPLADYCLSPLFARPIICYAPLGSSAAHRSEEAYRDFIWAIVYRAHARADTRFNELLQALNLINQLQTRCKRVGLHLAELAPERKALAALISALASSAEVKCSQRTI